MKTILVCGSRDSLDFQFVYNYLDTLADVSTVITGGAPGVDSFAQKWAETEDGIESIVVPANWDKYGLAAGPIRNSEMLKLNPDVVIAFPGGTGTNDMVTKAKRAGVEVIFPKGDTE